MSSLTSLTVSTATASTGWGRGSPPGGLAFLDVVGEMGSDPLVALTCLLVSSVVLYRDWTKAQSGHARPGLNRGLLEEGLGTSIASLFAMQQWFLSGCSCLD